MANPTESMAQFIDRFLTRTATGVLLVALAYGLGAATHLTRGDVARWLDGLQALLALAAVVVVLPAFVRFLRLRAAGACRGEPEGFIADAFRRAGANAFSLCFVALIFVPPLSERLAGLPTEFYASSVLFLALGAFSLTFFHRTRDLDEDDDGPPESEP